MNGPDLELQGAVVAALKASVALQALIGNPIRLYEDVPTTAAFPYLTIGETQVVPDLAECIDGSEIFVTLHIWTRAVGVDFAPAKRITATIDKILHEADLPLTDYRCVLIQRGGSRFFIDADNKTVHGVATYRALVDPTT